MEKQNEQKSSLKRKRKPKFEDYKNCLEATQLENKITYLEKNKVNVNSLKKNHKEFMKNNKLILKSQQRFRSEKQCIYWRSQQDCIKC